MGAAFLLILLWVAVVGGFLALLTGLTAVLALVGRYRALRRPALAAWGGAVLALLVAVGLAALVPAVWSRLQASGPVNQDGEGPWIAVVLLGSAGAMASVPAVMLVAYGGVFLWSWSRGGAGRTPSLPPPLPLR